MAGAGAGRLRTVRDVTDLSGLGADSLGVWTRKQALVLLTAGQIDAFVRSGVWQVLWRGVYADAGVVVTAEQRAVAAVLAAGDEAQPPSDGDVPADDVPADEADASTPEPPRRRLRAVACGRTAARFWRFPLIDDDDPATGAREHVLDEVAVARRLPRQSYGGRLLVPHRNALSRGDVVQVHGGLWVTTQLRTLVDCAQLLTHEALVCALDFALHHHRVSENELAQAVAMQAGRAGGPALRGAVALADGRAESPAETLARLLLLPVLPGLEPQVELFDEHGRQRARFDLGDRIVRLAVEADGTRGHSGKQMVAKDRRRDRWSDGQGWTTERVTWFELRCEQASVVQWMVAKHDELRARQLAA